jgi:PAS domain S-box-containing protein
MTNRTGSQELFTERLVARSLAGTHVSNRSKWPEDLPLAELAPAIIRAATRVGIGVDAAVRHEDGVRRIWTNETAARQLGANPERALTLDPDADVPVQMVDSVIPRPPSVPMRDVRVVDTDLLRVDHGKVPIRMATVDVDVGGHPGVVRCQMLTSELRGTQQALESSERRFRELIDAAPDWVIILDDWRIVYANRAVVEMADAASADELVGTSFETLVHPADLPSVRERVEEVMRSGKPHPPAESRLLRADGSGLPVEVISMATEWEGRPAVLWIGRQTAPRREAQAELRQAGRLSAIGTLAAGVAHEINNPLAYVLLNLQYLVRELPKPKREPERFEALVDRLNEAQHGAARVRSIVRDLRDFSSPGQTVMGTVDLRRALAAAINVSRAQVGQSVQLVANYAEVPPVRGDAARLEQVFLNLIVNAAHAFDSGSMGKREVQLKLFPVGPDRVGVEVRDNGVGIPAELLDRVFDPFFTTKPAGLGTGLGLPICHSIVNAHGGSITVESKVGKGTTFRVILPVFQEPVSIPSIAPPPMPKGEGTAWARVLVVDDELPVAAMVSRLLADEFDVRLATSGREALDLLLRDPTFDVILCDLLMPGMSGMDLYRELAQRAPGYHERLIFMTGGAFTNRAAEFLESTSQPRLEKPFDLEQVRRVVRRLAQSKR